MSTIGAPRGFLLVDAHQCRLSSVVEQRFCKPLVGSSNLSAGSPIYKRNQNISDPILRRKPIFCGVFKRGRHQKRSSHVTPPARLTNATLVLSWGLN